MYVALTPDQLRLRDELRGYFSELVTPERKAALVEAGVWDDPILRMKYAKRYAEYDRTKAAENRA